MRKIRVAYEIYTPDSVDMCEAAERGWINKEGWPVEPDEYDVEDKLGPVDLAVKYLREEGADEPSASRPAVGVWYTAHSGMMLDGTQETRSYHLSGFTHAEELEIFARMVGE